MRTDIVEVVGKAGNWASFKSIRAILLRTKNITTLRLRFSFAPAFRILPATLVLKNLTSLDANISHTALAMFLRNHPHITNLTIGACNVAVASSCPLTACHLPNLEELACPPGCVRALASATIPLTRLITFHTDAQDATHSTLRLFDFRRIPTSSNLTILHVDFDHTMGLEFLQRISAAAPALTVLRLMESAFSDKVR
jgi:hypothetical protein